MARSGEISRRTFLQGSLSFATSSVLVRRSRSSQRANSLNAKDFGAVGDGRSDDTAALQRAMDQAAQGQTLLNIPNGNYVVTETLAASSNLTLVGDNATLWTAIPEHGNSSGPVPTLQINGAQNVTVQGLRINGRGADFEPDEYKHCVSIEGSDSILIEDCMFFDAKGDGLILNDIKRGVHNSNVTVRRTICAGNFRLGLAVTDAENALFEDCVFIGNRGTSPMAGVDIEPDRADCRINNVVFQRCDMSNNGVRDNDGAGINIGLHAEPIETQHNIRFEACTIRGNGIQGVLCYNCRDVSFTNCEISGNDSSGIEVFRTSTNISISGGTISQNAVYGIAAVRDPRQVLTGLEIKGVSIEDNSQSSSGQYDGVHLQGHCRDITISDCVISGSHRFGIWLGRLTEDITLENNELGGNSSGETYPSDLTNGD
jgi:polygalacturonase